jgi:hypothetical protein
MFFAENVESFHGIPIQTRHQLCFKSRMTGDKRMQTGKNVPRLADVLRYLIGSGSNLETEKSVRSTSPNTNTSINNRFSSTIFFHRHAPSLPNEKWQLKIMLGLQWARQDE